MIVKVCGINDLNNFQALSKLPVDILGMVFYSNSPRSVRPDNENMANTISGMPVKKAGVFVDEDLNQITKIARKFNLTHIQLHGNESPDTCRKLKNEFKVIKAFRVGSRKDLEGIEQYKEVSDLFLFDTKGIQAGGTGVKFDWNLIMNLSLQVPYLLSGGIAAEDAERLAKLSLPGCVGIDINSCFEVKPGIKDISKVEYLLSKVK